MSATTPSSFVDASAQIRILVVEDDPWVRSVITRVLSGAGYAVTAENDIPEARIDLIHGDFDVVLTDLGLPSGSGLEILAAAQQRDPTLPVLVVSGTGDLEKAHTAVTRGALRFLTKPVEPARLLGAIEEACRTRAAVAAAIGHPRSQRIRVLDPDLARIRSSASLDAALQSLWLALQPVVAIADGRIVGYEALVRSDHPELARPDRLLRVAEDLARMWDIGRHVRWGAAAHFAGLACDVDLLVNLHANDLLDPELFDAAAPLSKASRRVILEITERASFTEIPDLPDRLASLRGLGFRLAIDDLGAGYGSLSALALVRPDLVKLDMSLIRGIDRDPVRRAVVRGIGAMCTQLEATWLCEGVETEAELATVVECGTQLAQGYLIGRPARVAAIEPMPAFVKALAGRTHELDVRSPS